MMQEQYEYLTLRDATVAVGQRVNFYGVVREYDQPKPTRGSDLICTMTVADMSYNKPGLRVIIFSPSEDTIPRVKSVGDVIRFHRVKINIHNNSPQAVANMKYGAAFILLSGNDKIGHIPYQVSSTNYTFRPYDEQHVDLLRDWIESRPLAPGISDYIVPISGMKEGSYFDLCCKLLVVHRREPDNALVLYVWDGTDAPPAHMTALQDPEGRQGNNSETFYGQFELLPREVICNFPPLGSIIPIVPNIPEAKLPIKLPKAGSWIKFRNLFCRIHSGIYEPVFLQESKIGLLDFSDGLVKERERFYHERLLSEDGHLPQWCQKPLCSITVAGDCMLQRPVLGGDTCGRPATRTDFGHSTSPVLVTDYEHIPFSTLREVLIHPKVTFKFRCVVRVIGIWPQKVEDFSHLKEPQLKEPDVKGHVVEMGILQYVYRLRLTLEDPTARIDAFLYGEDAEKFFNGHSAAEVQSCSATIGALQRKLNKFLGCEDYHSHDTGRLEKGQFPPWIKCCLKSYYLDRENMWASRRFRLFGTVLPG